MSKDHIIISRLKSIKYAFSGAVLLLKTEASIKIQICIAVLITIAGFYFNLSSTEWILQILTIGVVVAVEGLNTAIEKLADFIHPEQNQTIGLIKDVSAGAVLITGITAVIIGFIIYFPKIF